jgi:glutamate dehydrogenase (NAD(P)+)
MNFYWSREEVLERVDQKMSSAFQAVLEMSLERKVSMRDAAYLVAVDRVVKAMQMRGWV